MNQSTESSKKKNSNDNSNKIMTNNPLGNASFSLVSELLEIALLKKDEEILVKSRDFRYSIGKGIENIGFLKVNILKDIVVETGKKIEITLDGTIENELGHQETFTLFFYMWQDNQNNIFTGCSKRKSLESQSLLIRLDEQQEKLSDSVFDLILHKDDQPILQNILGKGRGFLVFGLPQDCREN